MTVFMNVRKSIVAASAITIAALVLQVTQSYAASDRDCRNYARNAVAQQRENVRRGCGFSGLRWHREWGIHRQWCLGVPIGLALLEDRERRRSLKSC